MKPSREFGLRKRELPPKSSARAPLGSRHPSKSALHRGRQRHSALSPRPSARLESGPVGFTDGPLGADRCHLRCSCLLAPRAEIPPKTASRIVWGAGEQSHAAYPPPRRGGFRARSPHSSKITPKANGPPLPSRNRTRPHCRKPGRGPDFGRQGTGRGCRFPGRDRPPAPARRIARRAREVETVASVIHPSRPRACRLGWRPR